MRRSVRGLLRAALYGPEATRLRRFFLVGVFAASVQLALLWLFVEYAALDYLVGAAIAIEMTILLQYVLNNAWTFREFRHTDRAAFLAGMVKTNLVRGSAIPIQLGVLYALVDWGGMAYIPGNVVAIGCSGIYRYVFDSRWTWS